jgi:hypothetical protein
MLRAYFVQQWFVLSDPDIKDALYDSPAAWVPLSNLTTPEQASRKPASAAQVGQT